MHSSANRDEYVQVLWNNIRPGTENNFVAIPGSTLLGTDYDYDSILHYRGISFSKNGLPTLVARDGSSMGQRDYLTDGDITRVNRLYKCSSEQ